MFGDLSGSVGCQHVNSVLRIISLNIVCLAYCNVASQVALADAGKQIGKENVNRERE